MYVFGSQGEHKIMDFIRAQSEDFRNGGRHVILSKDADFLMIGKVYGTFVVLDPFHNMFPILQHFLTR